LVVEEKEFDIQIFNISKYFRLCLDGNPNMLDSLFTPNSCITYTTKIGQEVRANRRLFVSNRVWTTFCGYSKAQYAKGSKLPDDKCFKYWYHLIRLLNEVEQLITSGEMDLQLNSTLLGEIKKGLWTRAQVDTYFGNKYKYLESIFEKANLLPKQPKEKGVKALLLNCLEEYYGTLPFYKRSV
jgi:uncharacterized protein